MKTSLIFKSKLFFSILLIASNITAQTSHQNDLKILESALPKAKPIQVMILGSYHMNNPEADQFNLEADDVMVPARQDEIQDVVNQLKKFNPTKIAIEAKFGDTIAPTRYSKYLEGSIELNRKEEEQIGFRLAKILGHQFIYPIDVRLRLNSEEVEKLVQANPAEFGPYLASLEIIGNGAIELIGKWLRTSTIGEVLYSMNDPEMLRIAHQLYYRSFVPIVKGDNYAGADMVNLWYQRNLRIFSNLHKVSEPGDRVLIIYGQGHIQLLKQFADDSPYFELVDPQGYLRSN